MKPFICVYGEGGVGKTTLCSGLPDTLYIDTELRVRKDGVERVNNWREFKGVLQKMKGVKRVVIDSLDVLEKHLWEFITSNYSDKPFAEQCNIRHSILTDMFLTFRRADVSLVVTASVTQSVSVELDPETGKEIKVLSYEPHFSGGKTGTLNAVEKHCDIIAMLSREKRNNEVRIGSGKVVIQSHGKMRSLIMDEDIGTILTKNVLSETKQITAETAEELQVKFLEFLQQLEG